MTARTHCTRITLWGFDISFLSSNVQLCVLGGAMLFCHVLQGILTEHVAKGVLVGLMWVAAAVELFMYTVLSFVEMKMTRLSVNFSSIPWGSYTAVALCISLGRGLTWVGYGTLSYPTVLLFKSSKIIVVMLSGLIILKKRFAAAEYAAASLAVAGLYMFSAADKIRDRSEGTDTVGGIGMMLLAVASEATVSTLQERALHREHRPLAEMIFVTNGIGAIFLAVVAFFLGELKLFEERIESNPDALLWLLATVSLAYGGSYAFTACIKGFGAVMATGMGICRKFVSVFASYILFPKPFFVQHAAGLVVFFAGLIVSWIHSWSKSGAHAEQAEGTNEGTHKGSGSKEHEGAGRKRSVSPSPRLSYLLSSTNLLDLDDEEDADKTAPSGPN